MFVQPTDLRRVKMQHLKFLFKLLDVLIYCGTVITQYNNHKPTLTKDPLAASLTLGESNQFCLCCFLRTMVRV